MSGQAYTKVKVSRRPSSDAIFAHASHANRLTFVHARRDAASRV